MRMMNTKMFRRHGAVIFAVAVLTGMNLMPAGLMAQNAQLQERVADLKEAMAKNKQELMQYQWQETQTTSVKGEQKNQQQFLVQVGADGKQIRMPINPQPDASQDSGRRLGHRIVEKKKEEFADYGKQVAELAQSYAQPDPGKIQRLYEQGALLLVSGGTPNLIEIVIKGYQKPGDTMTIKFDKAAKRVQSLNISSYLDNPKDVVTIAAQYASMPNGPNYVSDLLVNGVSKQLTVDTVSNNFQKK